MGLDSGLTVCQCLTSQCKHRLLQEVSPGAANVGSCLSSEHRRFLIRVSVYGVVVPRGYNPSNQTAGCPRTTARCPPHWSPPRHTCPGSQGVCHGTRSRKGGWARRGGKWVARALNCGRFGCESSASQNCLFPQSHVQR